ncbi:light harvesting complex protein [Tribonema minus]|uniref:Light harvesting complex protein n=1 Tax=Tribonema minus TaxID=303371 RepID=A0A835ZQ88_9STRA|nr:light harvesting complex protein [Tribonema minus]
MKGAAVCVLASLAGAAAFAPAFMGAKVAAPRVSSKAVVSMSVNDLLGADVETKGVWDPLGFSKDEAALFRRRVVELKHGRICMLATLGYLVAEVYHPLYDGKIPAGLGAISQVPMAGWLQIIAAIGVVELTVGKQDFENKAPGDLGFGLGFNPFPNDPEKFAALQLKELKNGRLAMMGIMGMMVQEGLTGQTPLAQLASGHISPFGDGQGAF